MFFLKQHRMISIALAVAGLLTSSAAIARIDIGLNIGVPGPVYAEPTYVAPEPVYAAPTYVVPVGGPAYYHGRHYYHGRRDYHHR